MDLFRLVPMDLRRGRYEAVRFEYLCKWVFFLAVWLIVFGRRAMWLVRRRSEEVFVLCYFDDGFSIELENVLYVELISNIGSI